MEQKESADREVIGLSTSCGVDGDRTVFMAALMWCLMKIKLWFTGEFFYSKFWPNLLTLSELQYLAAGGMRKLVKVISQH